MLPELLVANSGKWNIRFNKNLVAVWIEGPKCWVRLFTILIKRKDLIADAFATIFVFNRFFILLFMQPVFQCNINQKKQINSIN